MFECHACLRQTARLFLDGTASRHGHPGLILTPGLFNTPSRRHATSTTIVSTRPAKRGSTSTPARRPPPSPPVKNSASAAPARRSKSATPAISTKAPVQIQKVDALTAADHRDLYKELQFLTDPLKLADHVLFTLRCGKITKALELCRLASRTMQCIVSWNHVVNWNMQHGYIVQALKVYNEMKKRAQFPDSYTYVLLLRGLARSEPDLKVRKQNVNAALSIYMSMSAPNSRIQPRIIHTNAMLRVLSAAHDLDGLWSVVSKLPEAGDGSPDHVTYTTILGALKKSAMDTGGIDDPAAIAWKKMKAVDEGRKIWLDVIRKWRAGEVRMDEDLVSAMGSLLLISPRLQDADSVLDLVKQTTDIDRTIPPIGSPDRISAQVHRSEEGTLAYKALYQQAIDPNWTLTPAGKAFKAKISTTNDPRKRTPHMWANPGNAILSILINACAQMYAPKAGRDYWDLFTQELMVKPDLPNMNAQLRMLARTRSSRQAASILTDDLKGGDVKPSNNTFRLALDVCARDTNNRNVFQHATNIVNVMKENQPEQPCLAVLEQYLDLAGATKEQEPVQLIVDNTKDVLKQVEKQLAQETDFVPAETRSALLSFLKAFVGITQRLTSGGNTLEPAEVEHYKAVQGEANKLIGRIGALAEPSGSSEMERKENANHRREPKRKNLVRGTRATPEQMWSKSGRPRKAKLEHDQQGGQGQRKVKNETASKADSKERAKELRSPASGKSATVERRQPHNIAEQRLKLKRNRKGEQAQRKTKVGAVRKVNSTQQGKKLRPPASGKKRGNWADSPSELAEG